MLSIRADRPIAPLTLDVMREVDTLVKELKLTYFICGAMARDILLQHVHGIETGTVLLKLFAWTDRGNNDPKDALDLVTLLRTYHEAGNQDRLYGEELNMLEAAGFDPTSASPQLLGKDVRSIAQPETLTQALAVLNDAKLAYRLVTHMAPRLRHADDPIAEAERLLENFKAGLNPTSAP